MKRIIITGANGYLGSRISEHFQNNGIECIKLVRKPQDIHSHKYDLVAPVIDDSIFSGADYLIHLAYDFYANKSMSESLKVNVEGSINLFKIAIKHGIKIIFISSIGSFEGCQSNYGKTKLLIEKWLQKHSKESYIIRPGLVYGEKIGGITRILCRLAKLPIIPIVNSNNCHIVNYADILLLIDSIIANQQQHNIHNPIIAASLQPYTMKQILKLMNAKILIPISWQVPWLVIKSIEALGIPIRTGSDNLINLIKQNSNPDFRHTLSSGIKFSEFDTSLTAKWD